MTKKPLKPKKATDTVWLVRNPNHGGNFAGLYIIGYGRPPVLTRKRAGIFEWDWGSRIFPAVEFHALFSGVRLRPGEGPIEIRVHADTVKPAE